MDNVTLTNGTTTITLSNRTQYSVVQWLPSYDGRESIRFEVLGSASEIASRLRDVETVLDEVQRWHVFGLGSRWWINWRPSGLSNWVESEILYDERRPNVLRQGDKHSRRWDMQFTREPAWMGAESTISLTNGNGTGSLISVDNTDDSSRDNWVEISGSAVLGDMPAIVEIYMSQNSSGKTLEQIRYGLRVKYTAGSWQKYVLENDEAATIVGSQTSDSAYSGGNYHSGTLSGETDIAMWRPDPAMIGEFNGLWRLIARGNFPGNVWAIGRSDNASWGVSEDLVETSPVDGTGPFVDLGILRLPPWPDPKEDQSSRFELLVVGDGSGSWWLDYLMLMPAQEGYRVLSYDVAYWGYTDVTVDDGIRDEAGMESGTRRMLVADAVGKRLMLIPGYDQRIYFHQVGTAGGVDCDIDRQIQVTVRRRFRYRFFGS